MLLRASRGKVTCDNLGSGGSSISALQCRSGRPGRNVLTAGDIGQLLDIENERDTAVAENGGAGDAGHGAVTLLDALDDDLLVSEQLVNDDAEASPVAGVA